MDSKRGTDSVIWLHKEFVTRLATRSWRERRLWKQVEQRGGPSTSRWSILTSPERK